MSRPVAGVALALAGALVLWVARTPPHPVTPPAASIPQWVPAQAAQPQAAAASQQARPPEGGPSASSAVFEARFKASREAPRPAPDPAILQARTFAEAFQAMKRSELPAPAPEGAGVNPFGAGR